MRLGRDPEIRRLLVLSVTALGAFLLLYLLAVRTELGQRIDQAAFAGGDQTPERAADAAGRLLGTVSVGGLMISALVLGAVAALRRRPSLILVPAAVIGLTMISVEVLKHVVLTRPTLLVDPMFTANTYPSGHTAVAISIGLSAVLVSPARLRPWVSVGAAVLASGFGVFVVAAGWHFPSDALGAYALALAVAAAVMAVVLQRSPRTLDRERDSQIHAIPPDVASGRLERAGAIAAVAFFFSVIIFASLRYGSQLDWNRVDAAYLGSAAVIVFAAAVTVSALQRALAGPRRRAGARPR